MKKRIVSILAFLLVLLTACGQAAPTWQEQYDLGVRYLSEGNYEEAIIAFTAAIEIDPKRAEAYIGLADVYTEQGDAEKAAEILERAIEAIGEVGSLTEALKNIGTNMDEEAIDKALEPLEGYPKEERYDNDNGAYSIVNYDKFGQMIGRTQYNADGTISHKEEREYDEDGKLTACFRQQYGEFDYTTAEYYDSMQRLVREEKTVNSNTDESYEVGRNHTELYTYTYSDDGRSVDIFGSQTFEDGTAAECSTTYSMGDGVSYVSASIATLQKHYGGNDFRYAGSWIGSITEYEAPFKMIRSVHYNQDGTVNRID